MDHRPDDDAAFINKLAPAAVDDCSGGERVAQAKEIANALAAAVVHDRADRRAI
jgi:hypothetical protein